MILKPFWILLGFLMLTWIGVTWKNEWLLNGRSRAVNFTYDQPDLALKRNLAASAAPRNKQPPKSKCEAFYELFCKKSPSQNDPTGTVRSDEESEKEANRIYREIIRNHPNWSVEQVDEQFVLQVYTPQNRAKVHSAFSLVKQTLNHLIDQEPDLIFNPFEKTQIEERIRKVDLQLPPPASLYQDEPDLLTKSEFLYERKLSGETALRVGGASLLLSKSWFNMIFSLAHELGHSIDPCEIRSAGMSFPAYDHLVGCFLQHHLIAMRNTRSECGRNDQLSETFADWIAAQVTAEVIALHSKQLHGNETLYAVQNSIKDLCEVDDPEAFDLELHPSPKIRIEEIFGKNPKIQEILGCEPSAKIQTYCEFKPGIKHQPEGL